MQGGLVAYMHLPTEGFGSQTINPLSVTAPHCHSSMQSKLKENYMQLLMPAAASLFEAIESFAQAPHPLRSLLLKALRLLHVDLLLELTVEIGREDVHQLEFEVQQEPRHEWRPTSA